jgi:serine phosphatase RsbU (regulator of sigma subunit)
VGVTQRARIVRKDLYDFLSFTDAEVGLICADVSGKGTSAALMMANLQAVAHGRLLRFDDANVRPDPDAFVTELNRISVAVFAITAMPLCFMANLIPKLRYCVM